jgi:putative sigma-54 modulation protein
MTLSIHSGGPQGMNLDITGRHIEITPALKDFTEDKLRKLEKLLHGPLEVKVVLGIEKHRHTAEIQVKSKSAVFSGTQETGDLYASIGEVVDKLERQALKHKEKKRDHKGRQSLRDPEVAAAMEAATPPLSAAEAEEQRAAPRIHRSERYSPKPLSVEDAVLELDSTGEDLLVYRDASSGRVNVVYRRKDGDYGLVEPL